MPVQSWRGRAQPDHAASDLKHALWSRRGTWELFEICRQSVIDLCSSWRQNGHESG
jgi:hypothetical protein